MILCELIGYCLTHSDTYEDYSFDNISDSDGAWIVMCRWLNKKALHLSTSIKDCVLT